VAETLQSEAGTILSLWQRGWAVAKAILPTMLIFLIVGPLAGYFAIMVPIALTAIEGANGLVEGVLGVIALLPLGGLFAYMLGYVPALVTGLAVAVADCLFDLGQYRTPVAILMGAFITLALFQSAAGLDDPPANAESFGFIAGATGAFAAGICAMVAPRRVPQFMSRQTMGS
jgi:hypothetical protein